MSDEAWNPWKITALAVSLLMSTALATGLVVAQRDSLQAEQSVIAPVVPDAPPSLPRPATTRVASVPTGAAIRACNRYASRLVRHRGQTIEVVADGGLGGVTGSGTLYGVDPGRLRDEPYRAAYGACMRARGYTG